jgi:hypothetical protein
MAVITKTRHIKITDDDGAAQTGKTVIFYPAGTAANGTTASAVSGLNGVYKVTIDPTDPDGNVIDKAYDVWWDSAKKLTAEWVGYWDFTITVTMTSDTYTITYASEANLPSPIPNATMIGNPVPMEDMGVRLYSISDTVAIIKTTGIGTYNVNADNTMNVIVTIRGG